MKVKTKSNIKYLVFETILIFVMFQVFTGMNPVEFIATYWV